MSIGKTARALAVVLAPAIATAWFGGDARAADTPTVHVRICIPPNLVAEESWQTPYPGSPMATFRDSLRDYVAAHGGSGQTEYWIRDDAFDRYKAALAQSYTPDPRSLLTEVGAQQECPATNYTAELEVDRTLPVPTESATYASEDSPIQATAPSAFEDASEPLPAATEQGSSNELSDDAAGAIIVGGAAALLCAATHCLGGSSDSESSSESTYDYDSALPEDPINNAYQQYLDEQHAACVWSHTDISGC
jgi:hypothetical protein